MIVLLPPSETKAAGGAGEPLTTASLGFPGLAVARSRALAALDRLVAQGQDASTPAKARAAADNAAVRTSATMPAIDRYTGVLYDALDAARLEPAARRWVEHHLVIQSALLGFVRASDPIPPYKVSEHTRLPGERMRELWADAGEAIEGFTLDLRSKAYAALAPVAGAVPVEIVSPEGKALNHWNKAAKGRSCARSQPSPACSHSPTHRRRWRRPDQRRQAARPRSQWTTGMRRPALTPARTASSRPR